MRGNVPQQLETEAEEHELRSRSVFSLLSQTHDGKIRFEDADRKSSIPKIILRFWHDRKEIPDDVLACLQSWNILEKSGFKVLLFDAPGAKEFIADHLPVEYVVAFDKCDHPAMKCDFFRLCYLYVKGGFYVDADEVYTGRNCSDLFENDKLKFQPLCYDLREETMVDPASFLKLTEYDPEKIFYINNNPLVSPPGHKLIFVALERAVRLLSEKANLGIQEITGPGNLSASLVSHSMRLVRNGQAPDFSFIRNWENYSICNWFLGYRNDSRNWRLYKREQ